MTGKKTGILFWEIPGERYSLRSPALWIYAGIVVWYVYLLTGPFFTRPQPSDFLLFTSVAGTNLRDVFTHAGAERLGMILPVRAVTMLFRLTPADGGLVTIVGMQVMLLLGAILFCHRLGGAFAGVLCGCLLSSSIWVLLNVDLHADQIGAAYLVWAVLFAMESARGTVWRRRFFWAASGFVLALLGSTKPNFCQFFPLFTAPLIFYRRWEALAAVVAGAFAGTLLVFGSLIVLYPAEIWAHYSAIVREVSKVYHYSSPTNHHATNWFEYTMFQERNIIAFYATALFAYAYRCRGAREMFVCGWVYFVSLLLLSVYSDTLETSTTYLCCLVVPIAIGSALMLASDVVVDPRTWRGFLLCLGTLLLFIFGVQIGVEFQSTLSNDPGSSGAAALGLFCPVLLLLLIAWKTETVHHARVTALAVVFIALPQTIYIAAHRFDYTSWTMTRTAKGLYEITDRIDDRYLRNGPVLFYLDKPPNDESGDRLYLILASRLFPVVDIDVYVKEFPKGWKSRARQVRSIITDRPDQFAGQAEKMAGSERGGKFLYYLETAR